MRDWAEWQKSYLHGVLLIWPPAEIRAHMNWLREKYDPVSQSYCEAHVSLTPPFRKQPSEQDWQAVESVLKKFAAIDITLGPTNAWLAQSVIYLEVRPVEDLEKLRDALLATGLFAQPSFQSFVPHLTITEGLSDVPVTAELLAALENSIPQRAFRCDHLTYAKPNGSFCFTAERSIMLGPRKV